MTPTAQYHITICYSVNINRYEGVAKFKKE